MTDRTRKRLHRLARTALRGALTADRDDNHDLACLLRRLAFDLLRRAARPTKRELREVTP